MTSTIITTEELMFILHNLGFKLKESSEEQDDQYSLRILRAYNEDHKIELKDSKMYQKGKLSVLDAWAQNMVFLKYVFEQVRVISKLTPIAGGKYPKFHESY